MARLRILCWTVLVVLLFSGCSQMGRVIGYADEEDLAAQKIPEVPAHLRARKPEASGLARVTLEDGSSPPGGGGGAASVPGGPPPGAFTPMDDIVWTNPDDPDAPLPGLEETLAVKKTRGPWQESYQDAKKQAMRKGMPLLVWFTDTQRSPLCPFLSRELFSQPEFGSYASEHLVRLRLDFNVQSKDEDEKIRKKNYLETLKKRYNARGLPTVLVMAPDGTVTGRYRGYKRGEPEFYFGRIKNATRAAESHHKDWKKKMEKKGYREWQDRKGRPLFAKLLRYREGEMILVEPDGRRSRAKESQLSQADRMWLAAEKAKRGR